eukprot:gnl/TRDRNA2_/TRDRNA2_199693_c0_seq1.p1 gnl/TRDRNA2_/TRDRNA2_199693_c0~~gnl/TRDRNA2_/TRDRNA2_199693_c0_seq1.p1  ORF type:complete len:444 (-),score=71.42 gnl/TRDRNA2_/TRDRNA2_199693_c0_seq1:110-1441(-)
MSSFYSFTAGATADLLAGSGAAGANSAASRPAAGTGADAAAGTSHSDAWSEFNLRAEARAAGRAIDPPLRPLISAPTLQRPELPPVMLHEAVEAMLAPGLVGTYVLAAFGQGYHAAEILKRMPHGSRLAILADAAVDPACAAKVHELVRSDPRVTVVGPGPISELGVKLAGWELAGLLVDLSQAWQPMDDTFRGFSVVDDAPLDLRLDTSRGVSAANWLRTASVEELAWVIHAYGEDDDPINSLRIAEVVMERQGRVGPYGSMFQLVDTIKRAKTAHEERGLHPAKLTIQALRVFVNGELEQIEALLEGTVPLLVNGGRAVVVTSRRAEAAVVKSFVRCHEDVHPLLASAASPSRLRELYPLLQSTKMFAVQQACDPIWPAESDLSGRRGARSSATHVMQRVERSAVSTGSATSRSVRSDVELFVEPQQMPFLGGGEAMLRAW